MIFLMIVCLVYECSLGMIFQFYLMYQFELLLI
jgi:hypothetical protein